MSKQLKSSFALLLATIIWGSTFVTQSMGMDYVGPFTFQAVRCTLAAIVLLPVIALRDRKLKDGKTFFSRWADPTLWKAGLLCGVPLFLACNLQQVGLMDTDAGKSAFLTAMYIVFVPIVGIFRKEKPSKAIPLSVLLAVAGLYCLSCIGAPQIARGDWLLLGCAVAFSLQITFVDMYSGKVDPIRLNVIQILVCTIPSAGIMWVWETPSWSAIIDCWFPLCYAGILSMGIAYTLQIVGQKDLKPSMASLIMSLESVFAVLCGWIFLQERLTAWEAIGCVLVFCAVLLSQLPVKKTVNA